MTAVAAQPERPRIRVPRLVLLAIAGAWILALAADRTGRAPVFHNHGQIARGASLWAALVLFLLAWQAMVAAMMLPSTLPLIRLFNAASSKQAHASRARGAFLAGYAAIWTAFGAVAFLGDFGLHRGIDRIPSLAERPWLVAGSVLALAGAFQFSELKERCLSKCRHPGPYLLAHYRRGAKSGFRLGFGHGIFCLGCCWALMLVMFATGIAVLWWMAALTVLMVYEKIGRHGETVARVAGAALVVAAVFVLVHPTWLPTAFGGSRAFAADFSIGPGPATSIVRAGAYEIQVRLEPNRATRSGTVSLEVLNNERPVNGARVKATYTMLDMAMPQISATLSQTRPATYSRSGQSLGMAGRWGLRFEIAPAHGKSFAIRLVDEVAP